MFPPATSLFATVIRLDDLVFFTPFQKCVFIGLSAITAVGFWFHCGEAAL
jgi:hypothetical protein